jgi:hypothetical protein
MVQLALDDIIDRIEIMMPGQSRAWYERLGYMVAEGAMEMPWFDPRDATPDDQPAAPPPKPASSVRRSPPATMPSEATRNELISLCGGDKELAGRLVAMQYGPVRNEAVAWQQAIDSLLEDRSQLYVSSFY